MPKTKSQPEPETAPSVPSVTYAPHILRSLREICEVMGVGHRRVREWVRRGAPIAVEGEGCKARYSAEAASLQLWRELQNSKEHDR